MAQRDSSSAARGFRPGPPLRGSLTVPGSKSVAQRVLVAAALSGGKTRLGALPPGEDVSSALDCLRRLGVDPREETGGGWVLTGKPPGPSGGWQSSSPLPVGESGTSARLFTAAAALCGAVGGTLEVAARGTLLERSSAPLFACLRACGVGLTHSGRPDGWPVRIAPLGPPSQLLLSDPASSQEVTALLLALSAYPGSAFLRVEGPIPSRPYLDITAAVLERFGVGLEITAMGRGTCEFELSGPLQAPLDRVELEPDASSAAVALCAACISGGDLRIPGLDAASPQGDVQIVAHLRAFGCDAGTDRGALFARGTPRRGARLDLAPCPDLAPPLAIVAAVAARAGQGSVLEGLGTLRGKESDRLDGLASLLTAAGLRASVKGDALVIEPGARTGGSGRAEPVGFEDATSAPVLCLDPDGDHRMAFAIALLGLARENVLCGDPEVCSKSWPGFWEDLSALGAQSA